MRRLLLVVPVLLLTGCTAEDAAGIKIDLSQLNWQTGAIIALALLLNPVKIISGLTEYLGRIPALERILRIVGLLGSKDDSPGQLTQAETLELALGLLNRMPPGPLRDELALWMAKAATLSEVKPDGK
jgi:hypothetical protein